jgi:hypothetical protein
MGQTLRPAREKGKRKSRWVGRDVRMNLGMRADHGGEWSRCSLIVVVVFALEEEPVPGVAFVKSSNDLRISSTDLLFSTNAIVFSFR